METNILEVINLKKVIGETSVLQNISFSCNEHTALAICGKNGSGKSTLLKILAGIYEPTSGKIIRNTRNIGYVPEHFPENLQFRMKEYLYLIASFHGKSNQQIESEISKYIHLFGIESFLDTPLKQCSKGTKQKVGLIQALLMKPDLLLLDEPITGLDTASQHNLIHHLEQLKKQVTIIFTTHEDVMIDKLANQILNIESGEMLFNKESQEVKKIIKVKFIDKEIFKELDLHKIYYDGKTAMLTVNAAISDQILIHLLNKKCSVLEVSEKR
ncbi:ATP-binding cassette domain-containing protein [Heyndrickxia sp. NPDC080065]|uniref:ATP-binding cassette domain-containing protein n=1 Tax=Heyndrickxia sp. NPDC080065 TaxID=3390568 RepID=UPI003CFF8CC2